MTNKKVDFTALSTLPGKELTLGSQPYNNLMLILSLVFIIIPLVVFVYLPYFSNEALPPFLASTIAIEPVLLFFIVKFVLKRRDFSKTLEANQKSIHNGLKKFALENEFSISMREVAFESNALTMSFIDTQTLKNIPGFETRILKGKFAGFPMKLSDLVYVKVGKTQTKYPLQGRVMRLKLPQKLPHMIIDCHVDGAAVDTLGGSDLKSNDDLVNESSNTVMRKIDLEGDFHKYFSLYTEKENAVDALSILAPDVMQVLLNMHALCDIEIIDNYIYFIWSERKMNKTAYEKVFMTVQSVMDQIGYKLSHGDFSARAKPNSANTLVAKNGGTVVEQDGRGKRLSIITIVVSAIIIPAWMYSKGIFSTVDSTYVVAHNLTLFAYATIVLVFPSLIIAALVALVIYLGVLLPRRRKRINNEFRKNYPRK